MTTKFTPAQVAIAAAVCKACAGNSILSHLAGAEPEILSLDLEDDGISIGAYAIRRYDGTKVQSSILGDITYPVELFEVTVEAPFWDYDTGDQSDTVTLGEADNFLAALRLVLETEAGAWIENLVAGCVPDEIPQPAEEA